MYCINFICYIVGTLTREMIKRKMNNKALKNIFYNPRHCQKNNLFSYTLILFIIVSNLYFLFICTSRKNSIFFFICIHRIIVMFLFRFYDILQHSDRAFTCEFSSIFSEFSIIVCNRRLPLSVISMLLSRKWISGYK